MRRILFMIVLAALAWGPALAQESGPVPTTPPVPQAPPKRVFINRIAVTGVEGIPADLKNAIQALVKNYVGQELSLPDMQKLATEINELFRSRGYMLAQAVIPAQTVTEGSVTIAVLQGKIGEIVVEGNDDYSTEFLRARMSTAVGEDGVLMNQPFYRAVLLLNELPDLEVKTVLRPGKVQGTTDVVLQVTDQFPLHIGLTYNNFGTPQTSTHRFGTSVVAGNLLSDSDSLAVQANFGTPFDTVGVFQGAYSFPVNLEGTRLGVLYSNSAFTVGQELEILDIRGRANIFGATVSHPTYRTLDRSDDLTAAFYYKDILNTFAGGIPFGKDVYSSVRIGYSMDLRDLNGRWIFQPAITQGVGGNSANDPLSSRLGASGVFTKFNYDGARVQILSAQSYALLRLSGQLAATPLFVSEEFAIGGPDSVRGFSQSEFLGDIGYSCSAEINYAPIPEDPETDLSERQIFQLAGFIDHGSARRLNAQPGEDPSRTLLGAGVGVRLGIFDNTQLKLDLGFPIAGQMPGDPVVIPYAQMSHTFDL